MNGEPEGKSLTTADLAAAAEMPTAQREVNRDRKKPLSVVDTQGRSEVTFLSS